MLWFDGLSTVPTTMMVPRTAGAERAADEVGTLAS